VGDDLSGFGLKVTPAGNKVYLLQYRMGGRGAKTQRFTIGTHGSPWTPAGARDEAERLLTLVRQGVNPADEKAERQRIASDLAFSEYATRFLKEYAETHWKASYANAEGILRLHVTPSFKDKPLPLIRKADIAALFDRLPSGKVALRRNVFAVIRRLFRWAKGRGDIEINPLDDFEVPSPPAARDRVLPDDELRLVWLAAGNLGHPFGPLYRILVATGQRREEVSGLDWRELNRAAAEWTLPAARAKNGVASIAPLSPLAIAEIDGVAGGEKWPKRGLVLSTTGKTPVSGYSKGKARLDTAVLKLARAEAEQTGDDPEHVEVAPWRVHDLRRTFATGMQRLGVRFEVTEAVLNHVSGSKAGVAGVYQRHDWRDEKRDALNAWAAHVERIVSGVEETNVVRLASARA
jgi:integrase